MLYWVISQVSTQIDIKPYAMTDQSYKVLARKYRPTKFKDLIGQEALVTIICNSIKSDKIPHAILLSGIRGVGKTTSARIIAKSINCTNLNKDDLIEACGLCNNCKAFQDENHPDIIEFDAASKTGIDDIREIIKNCEYLPIIAKYKIYIIDEVHMLSNNAFNALLKTLEEPPAHVMFIFATTEARKLPKTIISRCQRFDLKRIDNPTLESYLSEIARIENININQDAVRLLVKNSDGSARDSMSLLDQAKNLGLSSNIITQEMIYDMLGIDYNNIYILLESIINSDISNCLSILGKTYAKGYDLIALFEELLELINEVSKYSILKTATDNKIENLISISNIELLSNLWQVIISSLNQIKDAPVTLTAAEMTIFKLCYCSKLPSISSLINKLSQFEEPSHNANSINSFESLLDNLKSENELILYNYLVKDSYLVSFELYKIEIGIMREISDNLTVKLAKFLFDRTKEKWVIKIVQKENIATIEEQNIKKISDEKNKWIGNPIFVEILENFNSAAIKEIRNIVKPTYH